MHRAVGAALGIALVAVLATGCGGGGDLGTGVSADAQDQLELQAAAVRQSAEAGDAAKADGYLTELAKTVTTLQSEGKIDDAAGARILHAAELVRSQLAGVPTTTAPPTTTTTAPPAPEPAPAPPRKKKGKGD
jgi:hypothetical protein